MTIDYSEDVAAAAEDIREAGFQATLHYQTKSGPDNDPTFTPATQLMWVVDLNRRQIVGGAALTVRAVRRLLVSTEGVTRAPQQEDKVEIPGEGKHLPITEVRPLAPGGVVVMWEVDLG